MARYWVLLFLIVLAGLSLRVYGLGGITLWLDETDFFNRAVYGNPPKPLLEHVLEREHNTTNAAGWFAVVWVSARSLGETAAAARIPSVAAGTASILAVFLLVWRVSGSFPPALFAAAMMAFSIVQIEFSQRTYAYAAVALCTALILLAHMEVRHALVCPEAAARLPVAIAAYAATAGFSFFIHPGLVLPAAASFAAIAVMAAGKFLAKKEERLLLFGLFALSSLVLFLAALVNAKNPHLGYRPYLDPYYHAPNLAAVPFLLGRTYDLLTYHLNVAYNPALYWPLRINPVVLPLLLIAVAGWLYAVSGRAGARSRHLALVAAGTAVLPALLSLRNAFPYGGVRQTMFLAPFIAAFTGLGFHLFRFTRWTRAAGAVLAIGYLGLCAANLPAFYRFRTVPFASRELVEMWDRNGRLPWYVTGGSEEAILYATRAHPEMQVKPYTYVMPPAPFLLVSLEWDIEHEMWDKQFIAKLAKAGYRATLLKAKPGAGLASWEYPTCLYFPPNGLWVYRVTPK